MRQVIATVGAILAVCVAMWLIAANMGTSQAAPADGVPFEKYWDDAGYESLRPSSVTFHLFREDAPDTELGSVTLTADDAVSGEDDHWHGVFAGIPVNDDDGEPIAYVVTEDVPENYIVSYDYGYDGYDITFADGSRSYSSRSMSFGYEDEDGTWWGGNMPSWVADGYTPPSSDRPIQLDDLVFRVDSTNLRYKQNRHTYVSDSWQTESWGIPNSDLKRMLRVYGTDKIQSMTDWPSGYSVAWEYAANLGRHTPHIRITEYSISWGRNAYSTDYAGLGIRYETSEIRPTRTPGGTIEITDTINLRSFPFTKVWDDEGYESYRPSSVTVDIYQDGQEQPYATKTISASDATDSRTWQAAFDDLPRYMTDGTYREHEYTIVERPVEGYEATYDSDYYNGIEFTFGEDTNIKFNTLYSYRGEERGWQSVDHPSNGWAHVAYKDSDGAGQVYAVAQNRRYAVEGTSMYLRYYDIRPYNGDRVPIPEDYEYGISINDVRRIHLDANAAGIVAPPDVVRVITGETPWQTRIRMQEGQHYRITKQEADSDTKGYLYEWDDTRPFPGADTITNHTQWREVTFKKVWDDSQSPDNRPESCTFDLQDKSGNTVKTVTLTADDTDPNLHYGSADNPVWTGSFGDWCMRDADGTPNPYRIVERPVSGYKTLYDSDDEQAGIMDVTLRLSGSESGIAYFDMATNSPQRGGESSAWPVSQYRDNPYIEQDGDVFRFSAPATRMLWKLPGVQETEVLSVSRRPSDRNHDYTHMGYLRSTPVVDSSVTIRNLNQDEDMMASYNKIYASKVGDSWERGDGDPADSYLLYEQTEPFDYCNVIWNTPMPSMLVTKHGEDQAPISGARLELVDEDTSEAVLSWVTSQEDATKEVLLSRVGRYAVHEAEPPTGHAFAPDVHIIADGYGGLSRVQDDGSPTRLVPSEPIIMRDRHTDVSIAKTGTDGKALPGCTIQVRGEDGSVVDEFVSETEPKRYQGVLTGGTTYVLHEVSAPAGYALAPDTPFTVGMDATGDKPQTVTLRNALTTVRISKVDITSQKELPGATLQILDATGKVVTLDGNELEWTSTSEPRMIEGLPAGSYTLRETVAPDGYAVTTDSAFALAKDGSVIYTGTTATDASGNEIILVEDSPLRAIVSKKALTGEAELPGARITLSEKNGEEIASWTSGDSPHTIDAGLLRHGKAYVIHEEGSPDGYAYAADIEFVAGKDGPTTVVTMRDAPTHVEISKVEVTGGAELPGATLRVLDADGTVIDEWVSTDKPHVIEGTLVAGKAYVLHEEATPEGHAYAADIEFTVSLDGSIDRVEMVDEVSAPSDEPVTPQGPQASDSQDSQGGQGTQAIASDSQKTPKGQQGANGQNSAQVASDRVKGTGTLPQMGADALGVMLPAVGIALSICGIRRASKAKRHDK